MGEQDRGFVKNPLPSGINLLGRGSHFPPTHTQQAERDTTLPSFPSLYLSLEVRGQGCGKVTHEGEVGVLGLYPSQIPLRFETAQTQYHQLLTPAETISWGPSTPPREGSWEPPTPANYFTSPPHTLIVRGPPLPFIGTIPSPW